MANQNLPIEISDNMIRAVIRLRIASRPAPAVVKQLINIDVQPPSPVFPDTPVVVKKIVKIQAIELPLKDAIVNVFKTLIADKIASFYDSSRELKTLLNFPNDRQELFVTWKEGDDPITIVGKMYRPLPADVQLKDIVWIGREISAPIIDRFVIEAVGEPINLVHLRPANRNIDVVHYYGTNVENKTLQTLLPSASLAISSSIIYNRDRVLEKYYTNTIEGSELNLNYADYREFIHFGSATKRLEIFKNKMQKLEDYNGVIYSQSLAMSSSVGLVLSGSAVYNTVNALSNDRLNLIRSFDGYEKFLYYGSGSSYSSSLTPSTVDELYFHFDATWPKISGNNVSVAIATGASESSSYLSPRETSAASSWYDNQSFVAEQYDLVNRNSLYNNIPTYLAEDAQSAEFHQFLHMIGHQFDIIKPYIDEMTQMYSRDSDPDVGLSKDLVWNVASSFGIDLPNQYAITNLVNYTTGLTDTSTKLYRDSAAEVWKRFLHNQISMLKSRGTKASILQLINVYGLNDSVVRIRESETPSYTTASQSFDVYSERTNALITSASYIDLPWSASLVPQSIEVRFATTGSTGVIYNTSAPWALLLSASSTASAKLQIVSASTVMAEVSSIPLGEDAYYNAVVQTDGTFITLDVRGYKGDTQLYSTSSIAQTAGFAAFWITGQHVFLGGSGSLFGPPYIGYIDEVRTWGEALSSSVIDQHARNPAAYYGNSSASAYTQLFTRLSFNTPMNYGSSSVTYAWNESPFATFYTGSDPMTRFSASGFSNKTSYPYSTKVVTRDVYRLVQAGGSTQYSTNKVVIAPAPTLRTTTISGSSVPILSRTRSIVSLSDKAKYRSAQNKIGIYISTTDAVNDSIIRTMGQLNYQAALGDPQALYSSSYTDLAAYNQLYWTKYAYTYDVNALQKIVRNILGPLFKQLPAFLPAKAKLITGLVVEPHILERNRVKTRELKFSGETARNADETLNRTINIPGGAVPSPTGDFIDWSVNYDTSTSSSVDVISEYSEALIRVSRSMDVGAENIGWEDRVIVSSSYEFAGERLDYDGYVNLRGTLLTKYRNIVGDSNLSWIVAPVMNFSNLDLVSATEYFYNTGGVYPTIELRRVRQNDAALTDKGTWTRGIAYQRNDVVLQSNSGSDGNTLEYRCMTSNILATLGSSTGSVVGFVSNIPPFYDTTNWVPVSYIPTYFRTIKKVVEISGSIALVSTGSSIPPFVGYHSDHFKFRRDTTTATMRRNYSGCKNTSDTTLDGKDPVETYLAPGDKLYAAQTSEPVQQNKNNAGPLLDVR